MWEPGADLIFARTLLISGSGGVTCTSGAESCADTLKSDLGMLHQVKQHHACVPALDGQQPPAKILGQLDPLWTRKQSDDFIDSSCRYYRVLQLGHRGQH